MAAAVAAETSFDHVKIAIRERPLTEEERSSIQVMLRTDNEKLIAFYPDSKEGLVYNYDYFYPEEATQLDLFQTIGVEMVDLVLSGYSSNCIAYGPSVSGKTHSLFGSDQEPGLIQLVTKELFHRMQTNSQYHYTVKFSYWEMNSDTIVDALSTPDPKKPSQNLPVRRGPLGIVIPGLTQVELSGWEELDEWLMQGNIRRIQLSEVRNARWHGFVKLSVEFHAHQNPGTKTSVAMTFAHLKGPDRVGQKGARKDIAQQGSNLNKSISLLGSAVLHAVDFRRRAGKKGELTTETLIEKSTSFFMESKFTQVLAPALCGGEATFILGTVCGLDYHETTDTLENLQNMQQLVCFPQTHVSMTDQGRLQLQLAELEKQVPPSDIADGHPLTEVEEKVVRLKARMGLVSSDGSLPPEDNTVPKGTVPKMEIPQNIQLWKQNTLKAKMHGDRATIYIPTAGGAKQPHTYKGEWAKGKKEGYGEHITKKEKYAGFWKDGERSGEGTLWIREKESDPWVRVYKGAWLNGKRHGRGSNWYPNGEVYEGFFENGVRSMVGKLFLPNGDRIEGQFRNDVTEGYATLFCKNGDRFEGQWSGGMREGPGVWHYNARQQEYHGEWHKNVPKCGYLVDKVDKETNAKTAFLPRVELADHLGVLDKEKRLLNEKRRREAEERGETWVPPSYEDDDVAMEAAGGEQVSWN